MANTIKHKQSNVAGKTPTTSDLELGELCVNTYDGKLFLKKDDGSASIVEVGGTVAHLPGMLIIYAGSSAPTGWLLCDGSPISRSTYPALFAVIGTTYGAGDGSTTFNIPDLRGRVVAGVDNMGGSDAGRLDWANTLGTVGGTQTHTLTTAEMPSHTHIQNSHNHTQNSHNHTQNSHNHTQNSHAHGSTNGINFATWTGGVVTGQSGGSFNLPSGVGLSTGTAGTTATNNATTATNNATTATNNATTAVNQNTGGGGAHNNMQPTILLNYIIKT